MLGEMLTIRPDILRSLLREGVLARIQPSLLGPYLKQRDDYNSSRLYRLVKSFQRGYVMTV
jgi:exocyst complex component 5